LKKRNKIKINFKKKSTFSSSGFDQVKSIDGFCNKEIVCGISCCFMASYNAYLKKKFKKKIKQKEINRTEK